MAWNAKKRLIGTLLAQNDALRERVRKQAEHLEELTGKVTQAERHLAELEEVLGDMAGELTQIRRDRIREKHVYAEERDYYEQRIRHLEEAIRRSLPDKQLEGILRDLDLRIP